MCVKLHMFNALHPHHFFNLSSMTFAKGWFDCVNLTHSGRGHMIYYCPIEGVWPIIKRVQFIS